MYSLLITLTGTLDVIGAIVLRYWAANHKQPLLILGVSVYAVMGLTFAASLRYGGVAISNILWIALSALLVTAAGSLLFHERIALGQMAGVALVIGGVILIQVCSKSRP